MMYRVSGQQADVVSSLLRFLPKKHERYSNELRYLFFKGDWIYASDGFKAMRVKRSTLPKIKDGVYEVLKKGVEYELVQKNGDKKYPNFKNKNYPSIDELFKFNWTRQFTVYVESNKKTEQADVARLCYILAKAGVCVRGDLLKDLPSGNWLVRLRDDPGIAVRFHKDDCDVLFQPTLIETLPEIEEVKKIKKTKKANKTKKTKKIKKVKKIESYSKEE
jgi:hypothetical protein